MCLRENDITLLYVYCDGVKSEKDRQSVLEVRRMIHDIDWCEKVVVEREENLGLGKSIIAGVSEVLLKHNEVLVFEDDLVCVPGTYEYLCSALKHYANDPKVMSVTGWTHTKITPDVVTDQPYFDGRAECWVWGTWARAWKGMQEDAQSLMNKCDAKEVDIYRYGADLVEMAKAERQKNIWAVRFLYWHILNGGLCLRPPYSMVDHIGFDSGTNCALKEVPWWVHPSLQACPAIPAEWPEPVENNKCSLLHQNICGARPVSRKVMSRILSRMRRYMSRCDFRKWRRA